ncbi:cell division protein ZapA [Anaerosphaera aminiphila DSM 21120]|uniref:Cell division protein ZapA n=1 Tax=Anaerosphaera aminiphila DSM 21120 TaxID=1120995 RepID=A0A1M5T1C3_9FIRM|nr:cell division protein ZapA [Anaerosphaera aminiphila]SHH44527.1 cell division protein ZapA [Anaerosphaera aminiphila DSM 21120]
MSTDKKVKVQINDMNFYVVGDDNDDYIKGLAKSLDEKIKKVQNSNYKLNQVQCLVLTALNILDEKEKFKKEEEKVKEFSKNNELYRKSIKKIEDYEKLEKTYKEEKEKNDSLILRYRNSIKDLETDNRELRMDKVNKNKEFEDLKTEVESLKKEKQNLEKQIYESQKKVIDLSREIESINEE